MAKTLKDLVLAMLNATLILVAVCLLLMLLLVSRANSLTETFAQNLQVVPPLQESVRATRDEIAGLRADLTELRTQSQDVSSDAMARIHERIAAVEAQLQDVQLSMASLRDAPARLLDHAIEQTADQAVISVARIRGCTPAAPEQSEEG